MSARWRIQSGQTPKLTIKIYTKAKHKCSNTYHEILLDNLLLLFHLLRLIINEIALTT
jgi:hypothetical protein